MGRLKLLKGKTRKIMFSERQMLIARDSKKFKTHREFVEFLFKGEHHCKVEDHSRLEYHYSTRNKVCMVSVTGQLGRGLVEM